MVHLTPRHASLAHTLHTGWPATVTVITYTMAWDSSPDTIPSLSNLKRSTQREAFRTQLIRLRTRTTGSQVLRTVDASVTIPYWDYTIDLHRVAQADEVH